MRIIKHFASDAVTELGNVSSSAIAGCWFELHRQGGCGPAELNLHDDFLARHTIDIGDWLSFEYTDSDRWYFGRVESREATSPNGVKFRLEGMSIELGEVFLGGFGVNADGVPPHRYANTDQFPHDPDYDHETFDSVDAITALIHGAMFYNVVPATHISYDPANVEEADPSAGLSSFKFRGEESVLALLRDLAMRSRNASWGVDENGDFFFLQQRTTVLTTLQEGVDPIQLDESRDRDLLYNRVLLTGGFVYDKPDSGFLFMRRFYRYRANFVQPDSRELHGERRIKIWIPWIRTETDALSFVREFFRVYSSPVSKFLLEIPGQTTLLKPWEGPVRLLDRNGTTLITAQIETVRVMFDRVPRFRMELGPGDPQTLWSAPPQNERYEVGDNSEGGDVSVTTEDSEDPPPETSEFIDTSDSSNDSFFSESSFDSSSSEQESDSDTSSDLNSSDAFSSSQDESVGSDSSAENPSSSLNESSAMSSEDPTSSDDPVSSNEESSQEMTSSDDPFSSEEESSEAESSQI